MRKLLLADDNATIRRVVALAFAGEDMEVIAVDDGEQAIARVSGERPDVVLADIEMPKRSGYDVAAFVKSQPELAHIPVLLLSGAFDPLDTALAAQVGCNGVLVKPFDPLHVVTRVRELLDGAKGLPADATAPVPRPIDRLTTPRRDPIPFPPPDRGHPVTAIGGTTGGGAAQRSTPGGSLDEYFDQLDAAFASLGSEPRAHQTAALPAHDRFDPDADVPTLDDLLAGSEPYEHRRDAADPFDLFHSEQAPHAGATPASTPSRPRGSVPPTAPTQMQASLRSAGDALAPDPGHSEQPVLTDAFLDDVARRVLQRLSQERLDRALQDIVSKMAERLIREEIQRIRNGD